MSESEEARKKRKKEERKKRREARKLEKMKKKEEELRKRIAEREQAEKEEYEPAIIKEKGYEVVDVPLGKGTFADVYQAKKGYMDIAMKMLDLEAIDDVYKERFLPRQLAITELLDSRHKHIIQIHDIFKTSKRVFFMMELAAKGSVHEYVNDNGAVAESVAKKWLVEICKGLNYLHTNDVAHRNIRTENILLDNNLSIKLSGFSFTRLTVDPYSGAPVYSSTNCGAAPYYPPEIIKGERYDPKAADVWSTGVVLFIVANKKYPFDYRDYTVLMNQQQTAAWKQKMKAKLSSTFVEFLSVIFNTNFKQRIKIRKILDHPLVQDVEGNSAKDRDEKADIKESIKRVFVTENVESPGASAPMSSIG